MNIPQLKLGCSFRISESDGESVETSQKEMGNSIPRKFFPFIRIGLGMTEIGGARGPKHPSYCTEVGVQRMMSDISKLSLSVEYLYDWASFRFINNQSALVDHWAFARMSLQCSHELMFGHIALVTTLGVYFNKHAYQRSVLLSKVGIQCYLHSYFKKCRHQVMVGAFIRAYGGEAERFELTLGYHL